MPRRALIALFFVCSLAAFAASGAATAPARADIPAGAGQVGVALHTAPDVVLAHLSSHVQRAPAHAGRTIRAGDRSAAVLAGTVTLFLIALAWALRAFMAPRRGVVLLAAACGRAPPLRPALG
jgi:hypothetical protein